MLATQIGRSVFVHGGLTKEHLEEYGGIEGMNEKARRWFEEEVSELSRSEVTSIKNMLS